MSGMSSSGMGALNTSFMRLAIVSQYARGAVAGCYCMYSAVWHVAQLACALA